MPSSRRHCGSHYGARSSRARPGPTWPPSAPAWEIRERGIERSIDTPSPAVSSLSVPVLDAAGVLRLVLTLVGSTGAIDVDWHGAAAQALQAAAADIGAALRDEQERPA